MSLRDTFLKAADTVFKVFRSIVHSAVYVQVTESTWADVPPTEVDHDVNVIIGSFGQDDIRTLSFSSFLQPTDMKGMIKGVELPRPITTRDLLRIPANDIFPAAREFSVVAWDTDPAEALFIFALREV